MCLPVFLVHKQGISDIKAYSFLFLAWIRILAGWHAWIPYMMPCMFMFSALKCF